MVNSSFKCDKLIEGAALEAPLRPRLTGATELHGSITSLPPTGLQA